MCVLAARTRVSQIYIKVLLPVLFLESSRFVFSLPDLKNKQVWKLFKGGGRENLADCRFGFILGVSGLFYQHFIKISRHTEFEWTLQKTRMYPLPRFYSYSSVPVIVSPTYLHAIGQFGILRACQSQFQTSVHFP